MPLYERIYSTFSFFLGGGVVPECLSQRWAPVCCVVSQQQRVILCFSSVFILSEAAVLEINPPLSAGQHTLYFQTHFSFRQTLPCWHAGQILNMYVNEKKNPRFHLWEHCRSPATDVLGGFLYFTLIVLYFFTLLLMAFANYVVETVMLAQDNVHLCSFQTVCKLCDKKHYTLVELAAKSKQFFHVLGLN